MHFSAFIVSKVSVGIVKVLKAGKVNGGNFGHGVIHGYNSLFRNKRKIFVYISLNCYLPKR